MIDNSRGFQALYKVERMAYPQFHLKVFRIYALVI
jgi:hypothetical protein